jgi:hypothetical protein
MVARNKALAFRISVAGVLVVSISPFGRKEMERLEYGLF